MADLEIGGYFTPDGILSAAERLAAAVRQLSHEEFDAPEGVVVPVEWEDSWLAFTQDFLPWKAEHISWLSRAWDTTRDELAGYVERYQGLRATWKTLYPATAAPDLNVTSDTIGGALKDAGKAAGAALQDIAIGLAVLIGVGVAGYAIWKASA